MDEKRFLTVQETAKCLKISATHMYDLVHSKGFPSFKVGGRWRVDKSKLDKWIDKQIQVKDSECIVVGYR